MLKSLEAARKFTDVRFSLGLALKEDGGILDVIPGSPADQAGIGAAMKLVAVNGRRWTPALLRIAVKAAMGHSAPIELLLENEDSPAAGVRGEGWGEGELCSAVGNHS